MRGIASGRTRLYDEAYLAVHPNQRFTELFVNFAGGGGWLRLKTDGVDFRLEPVPLATCLAAYDHQAQPD